MSSNTPQGVFDQDDERYLLTSRAAIISALRELHRQREILTAYFNHGKENILTAVLEVMPDRNLVILDYGADEKLNQRLLDSGRVTCTTKHFNIRFSCENIQRAKYQQAPAFAAPLPATLFRQQRREYFRVTLPQINPVLCRIPLEDGGELELPIGDISAGGLSLLDSSCQLAPEPGEILQRCTIILPGEETQAVDLLVCNSFRQPQNNGQSVCRTGCAFKHIYGDGQAAIQRLVNQLQAEQIARQG